MHTRSDLLRSRPPPPPTRSVGRSMRGETKGENHDRARRDEVEKYRSMHSHRSITGRGSLALSVVGAPMREKMAHGIMMMTTTTMTMTTRGGVATTSRTRRCATVIPRAAGAAAAKKKNGSTDGPYKARNEFTIPSADAGVRARFESEMRDRETLARELGAVDAKLVALSNKEFAFEQTWASKEAYEAYMNHPRRRRSHLAVGVYQRLPSDKWSVPDNFTPVTRD